MEAQVLIKLTMIVGKMEIADELKKIDKSTKEEVGTELIIKIIQNLYKVETELYELIALKNNITVDEAKKVDAIKFIKDLFASIPGLKNFLA
jgi:hypothetical protein